MERHFEARSPKEWQTLYFKEKVVLIAQVVSARLDEQHIFVTAAWGMEGEHQFRVADFPGEIVKALLSDPSRFSLKIYTQKHSGMHYHTKVLLVRT